MNNRNKKGKNKIVDCQSRIDLNYGKGNYTVISSYQGSTKNITIQCNQCGSTYEILASRVLCIKIHRKKICDKCYKDKRFEISFTEFNSYLQKQNLYAKTWQWQNANYQIAVYCKFCNTQVGWCLPVSYVKGSKMKCRNCLI